jgi:hypothetical protein
MGKATASVGAGASQIADAIITGWNNTIVEGSSPITLDRDSQIVGGDNNTVGLGGTLYKMGDNGKIVTGIEVGPNSTYSMTSMDDNTQSLLDQAFTIVSTNANNMMALAAGRDANKDLADNSTETTAKTAQIKTTLSGLADILTPARIGTAVALLGIILFIKKGRKK